MPAMLLSNSNRKSFSLSLNLSLTKSRSSRSATDPASAQKPLPSLPSPMRDTFASPWSPQLPASPLPKPEQPLLAIPLADSLDPSERMNLLRKSRKLSRILGEVPIPVPVDDLSGATHHPDRALGAFLDDFPPTPASPSLCVSPVSSGSAHGVDPTSSSGSLRRSATVAHNRFKEQSEIHRARSLASLRPSLSIPRFAAAFSSTLPARDDLALIRERLPPPVPPSPISPVSSSSHSINGFAAAGVSRRDSVMSSSSRRDSTSSLGWLQERTPEQVQRARAAKLTRQLGENVPPDVLRRAASPMPRPPMTSPSMYSLGDASLETSERPLPPTPDDFATPAKRARRDRRAKRRLSLDVRSEASSFVSAAEEPRPRGVLKKSGSMRRKPRPLTAGAVDTLRARPRFEDSDTEMDADDDLLCTPEERKRALNVRRARKMAQVCSSCFCGARGWFGIQRC